MIREDDNICLFKIIDGTLIFSESAFIEDDGVTFDMAESWVLVTKTDKSGKADLQMFTSKDMMFKPTTMYFPWTAIVTATDMDEESLVILRKAYMESPDFLEKSNKSEDFKESNVVEGKF